MSFPIIFLCHSMTTVNQCAQDFKPYISPTDMFTASTGVFSGYSASYVLGQAIKLHQEFPANEVWLRTGSKQHIRELLEIEAVREAFSGVIYVYEPNLPDFDGWEFPKALDAHREAAAVARGYGMRFMGKPTGRPLAERSLLSHNWQYNQIEKLCDGLTPQFQTWARQDNQRPNQDIFKMCLLHAGRQLGNHCTWYPQITVALGGNLYNGVPGSVAAENAELFTYIGAQGVMLQWHTKNPIEVVAMLERLRPLMVPKPDDPIAPPIPEPPPGDEEPKDNVPEEEASEDEDTEADTETESTG